MSNERKLFKLGRASEIPLRGAREVLTPIGSIAIFRDAESRFYALDNKCPHKGGPLAQGIVHGQSVTCPLHNMIFDLETGRARAPDEGCLARFDLVIENDVLFLDIAGLEAAKVA